MKYRQLKKGRTFIFAQKKVLAKTFFDKDFELNFVETEHKLKYQFIISYPLSISLLGFSKHMVDR